MNQPHEGEIPCPPGGLSISNNQQPLPILIDPVELLNLNHLNQNENPIPPLNEPVNVNPEKIPLKKKLIAANPNEPQPQPEPQIQEVIEKIPIIDPPQLPFTEAEIYAKLLVYQVPHRTFFARE